MPEASPDANLAEVLSQWTQAFGWLDRAAFLCGDDHYTHGEVHRGAARMGDLLGRHGVLPGESVAIALPASIEFVWAFLGAVRIGAIAILADPNSSVLPRTSVAVCTPGRHPHAVTPAEILAELPRARLAKAHPVLPGMPAYIQYGTTYAHSDPEEAFLAMEPFGLRENDVLFSVPKTYDPVGLCNTVFLPLFSGASAVLDSGLRSVPQVAARVRRHRASVLLSTAAFFTRLAAEGTRTPFEPLRLAVSQGNPPPPIQIERALGCRVVIP